MVDFLGELHEIVLLDLDLFLPEFDLAEAGNVLLGALQLLSDVFLERLLHLLGLLLHRAVPVVLDRVVRATNQNLSNMGPLLVF